MKQKADTTNSRLIRFIALVMLLAFLQNNFLNSIILSGDNDLIELSDLADDNEEDGEDKDEKEEKEEKEERFLRFDELMNNQLRLEFGDKKCMVAFKYLLVTDAIHIDIGTPPPECTNC